MDLFEVKELSRHFGGITAVDNVTFSVERGEILGVIGPNGSGKSTLFNCLLGQLQPSSGSVYLDNSEITGFRSSVLNRRGVSRTFQLLQVFPELTVQENLVLAGQEHQGSMFRRLLGRRDAGLTGEADQLIDKFRLDHLRYEIAGNLSYGQQKLLDCAMSFMSTPRLVLLDEPAGGVNLTMLGTLKERLEVMNRDTGTTMIVIEHNMDFVMELCTRLLVLAEGKVLAAGQPDVVRNDPRVIDAYLGN